MADGVVACPAAGRVRHPGPAGRLGPDGDRRPAGIRQAQVPALAAPAPAGPAGRAGPLAGPPGPRRIAGSPVRIVRPGRADGGAGRRGPQRAGDQADALSHQRRFADHPRPGAGRRERQAGHRAGRAQGPVRGGQERQLGAAAGGCRLLRHLRHCRVQDARQVALSGAAGVASHPPLCASFHGKLQRQDRAALFRHRPVNQRFGFRRRRGGVFQPADRLVAAGGLEEVHDRADRDARPPGRADRAGNPNLDAGIARRDRGQAQFAPGPQALPGALSRQPGGRQNPTQRVAGSAACVRA